MNAPILAFPCLELPFVLDADASDSGLGAILQQVQDGQERVRAYASRALSVVEAVTIEDLRDVILRTYMKTRKCSIVTASTTPI